MSSEFRKAVQTGSKNNVINHPIFLLASNFVLNDSGNISIIFSINHPFNL